MCLKVYTPSKSYPVHIFLHGLVDRRKDKRKNIPDDYLKKLMIDNTISIFPSAWKDEKWWQKTQIDNISEIIAVVKKEYNVDTNRVYLHGVSDGGHGVYYIAAHAPTKYAAFLPLIASPFVATRESGADAPAFFTNLINKPLFIVNGTHDHLYPSIKYSAFIDSLNKSGATVEYEIIENGKHNLSWLKNKEDNRQRFIRHNVRDPYPNRIYWEVDSVLSFPRYHWLVIQKVEVTDKEKFVHINKVKNEIVANVKNVTQFTLLISPEDFNIKDPIKIIINGKTIFNKVVIMKTNVLKKWFEIDLDINQLYGSELSFSLSDDGIFILVK